MPQLGRLLLLLSAGTNARTHQTRDITTCHDWFAFKPKRDKHTATPHSTGSGVAGFLASFRGAVGVEPLAPKLLEQSAALPPPRVRLLRPASHARGSERGGALKKTLRR